MHHMLSLSHLLDQHADIFSGDIILLDYPVHQNIGDLLIWKGEQLFLQRNGRKLIAQYSISNFSKKAKRRSRKCQTICLHGGGNFGDLWPRHQLFRENIIAKYPEKRIIILPQSLHYEDVDGLDHACEVLKRHNDLHILLRDKRSLQVLHDRRVPNLRLCPDMAHALWGTYSVPAVECESTPLYLLRTDKEKRALPDSVRSMIDKAVDWGSILVGPPAVIFHMGRKLVRNDANLQNRLPACTFWNLAADVLIRHAVKLIAPHKTVITDRLHAVILSELLGKQVVAYDNSYGKLSSYISLWLETFRSSVSGGCLSWRNF